MSTWKGGKMKNTYVTTENNEGIKWICVKVRAEQEKRTDEQKAKGAKPKPIADHTVVNIAILDYSSNVFAIALHQKLAEVVRGIIK